MCSGKEEHPTLKTRKWPEKTPIGGWVRSKFMRVESREKNVEKGVKLGEMRVKSSVRHRPCVMRVDR